MPQTFSNGFRSMCKAVTIQKELVLALSVGPKKDSKAEKEL